MADNKKNKRNNNRNNNMDEDFNPKFRKVRKKVCPLCADKNLALDYKNVDQLKNLSMIKEKYFQEEQLEHVQNTKEI